MQEGHLSCLQQWEINKNSWCRIIDYLLTYTDMKQSLNLESIILKPNIFIKEFKDKITSKYQQFWRQELESKKYSKLELYTKIKKNHCFEKYLDVLDKEKKNNNITN